MVKDGAGHWQAWLRTAIFLALRSSPMVATTVAGRCGRRKASGLSLTVMDGSHAQRGLRAHPLFRGGRVATGRTANHLDLERVHAGRASARPLLAWVATRAFGAAVFCAASAAAM